MHTPAQKVTMETIKDKLKKIQALAKSGIGGEKETAQRMLNDLCKKYHITIDEIISEEKKYCTIRVRDKIDEILVRQTIIHICQTNEINNKRYKDIWMFELTHLQAIEVQDAIKHYRKEWKKQLHDFMIAFIHKNSIFNFNSDKTNDEIDLEALIKLRSLMAGMKANPWEGRKRIELHI